MGHAGIQRTATTYHRRGMLRAEKPDGKIYEWHAESTQNCERGRKHWCLSARGKTAQQKIAHVDEPHDKGRSEAPVPGPPDAPDRTPPDRAGHQVDGQEHNSDFSGDEGDDICSRAALDQIKNRRSEVYEEEQ